MDPSKSQNSESVECASLKTFETTITLDNQEQNSAFIDDWSQPFNFETDPENSFPKTDSVNTSRERLTKVNLNRNLRRKFSKTDVFMLFLAITIFFIAAPPIGILLCVILLSECYDFRSKINQSNKKWIVIGVICALLVTIILSIIYILLIIFFLSKFIVEIILKH